MQRGELSMRAAGYHSFTIFLAVISLVAVMAAGCASGAAPAPAAESASEDMTEAALAADTAAAPAEEEPKLTTETAVAGICLSRSSYGDNERLAGELREALAARGFLPDHILSMDITGNRQKQQEEIDGCLAQGCNVLIISPVENEAIPGLADRISDSGASAVFVNCIPPEGETARWASEEISAVWIGTTYADELACQMKILYDCSGQERGIDFNEDGHVGAVLIGGGEEARSSLEETVRDLGSELQILAETDLEDAEEISAFTQEILNTHKKEAELFLCSTEAAAQAAADGVQLRHRLVGRDILVIGTGAHEDTCTAIINKLMTGSVFMDFYEQANLAAVASKDLVEGNQESRIISNVIFKVTEENAQEVLDQLWKSGGGAAQEEAEEEAQEGETEEAGEENRPEEENEEE